MDSIPVHNIDERNSTSAREPQLHVASLIVHARPDAMADVAAWLNLQPKVEIHTQSPEGKFAVVMEADHEQAILDLLDSLGDRPGVLNTALIYHEMIDGEEEPDEVRE